MADAREQAIAAVRPWAEEQVAKRQRRTQLPGWQALVDFDAKDVDHAAQAREGAQEADRVEQVLAGIPEPHRAAYLAGRRAGRDDAAHLHLPHQVARDVVALVDR